MNHKKHDVLEVLVLNCCLNERVGIVFASFLVLMHVVEAAFIGGVNFLMFYSTLIILSAVL